MKLMHLLLMISIGAAVAGCVQNRTGNACDGWKPIVVSDRSWTAMPDEDRRALVEHNEHGERTCGWRPAT